MSTDGHMISDNLTRTSPSSGVTAAVSSSCVAHGGSGTTGVERQSVSPPWLPSSAAGLGSRQNLMRSPPFHHHLHNFTGFHQHPAAAGAGAGAGAGAPNSSQAIRKSGSQSVLSSSSAAAALELAAGVNSELQEITGGPRDVMSPRATPPPNQAPLTQVCPQPVLAAHHPQASVANKNATLARDVDAGHRRIAAVPAHHPPHFTPPAIPVTVAPVPHAVVPHTSVAAVAENNVDGSPGSGTRTVVGNRGGARHFTSRPSGGALNPQNSMATMTTGGTGQRGGEPARFGTGVNRYPSSTISHSASGTTIAAHHNGNHVNNYNGAPTATNGFPSHIEQLVHPRPFSSAPPESSAAPRHHMVNAYYITSNASTSTVPSTHPLMMCSSKTSAPVTVGQTAPPPHPVTGAEAPGATHRYPHHHNSCSSDVAAPTTAAADPVPSVLLNRSPWTEKRLPLSNNHPAQTLLNGLEWTHQHHSVASNNGRSGGGGGGAVPHAKSSKLVSSTSMVPDQQQATGGVQPPAGMRGVSYSHASGEVDGKMATGTTTTTTTTSKEAQQATNVEEKEECGPTAPPLSPPLAKNFTPADLQRVHEEVLQAEPHLHYPQIQLPEEFMNFGLSGELKRRLEQRRKQIQYGKGTIGYANYRSVVPLVGDREFHNPMHPMTPRPEYHSSKRAFDKVLNAWRRQLHKWDAWTASAPDGQTGSGEGAVVVGGGGLAATSSSSLLNGDEEISYAFLNVATLRELQLANDDGGLKCSPRDEATDEERADGQRQRHAAAACAAGGIPESQGTEGCPTTPPPSHREPVMDTITAPLSRPSNPTRAIHPAVVPILSTEPELSSTGGMWNAIPLGSGDRLISIAQDAGAGDDEDDGMAMVHARGREVGGPHYHGGGEGGPGAVAGRRPAAGSPSQPMERSPQNSTPTNFIHHHHHINTPSSGTRKLGGRRSTESASLPMQSPWCTGGAPGSGRPAVAGMGPAGRQDLSGHTQSNSSNSNGNSGATAGAMCGCYCGTPHHHHHTSPMGCPNCGCAAQGCVHCCGTCASSTGYRPASRGSVPSAFAGSFNPGNSFNHHHHPLNPNNNSSNINNNSCSATGGDRRHSHHRHYRSQSGGCGASCSFGGIARPTSTASLVFHPSAVSDPTLTMDSGRHTSSTSQFVVVDDGFYGTWETADGGIGGGGGSFSNITSARRAGTVGGGGNSSNAVSCSNGSMLAAQCKRHSPYHRLSTSPVRQLSSPSRSPGDTLHATRNLVTPIAQIHHNNNANHVMSTHTAPHTTTTTTNNKNSNNNTSNNGTSVNEKGMSTGSTLNSGNSTTGGRPHAQTALPPRSGGRSARGELQHSAPSSSRHPPLTLVTAAASQTGGHTPKQQQHPSPSMSPFSARHRTLMQRSPTSVARAEGARGRGDSGAVSAPGPYLRSPILSSRSAGYVAGSADGKTAAAAAATSSPSRAPLVHPHHCYPSHSLYPPVSTTDALYSKAAGAVMVHEVGAENDGRENFGGETDGISPLSYSAPTPTHRSAGPSPQKNRPVHLATTSALYSSPRHRK